MLLSTLITPLADSITDLLASLKSGENIRPLSLRRASRLPMLAALQVSLNCPIFYLTDRSDRALTLLDELALWLPNYPRLLFPEPNPLFYENAPWSDTTRRERLQTLTLLSSYHIPVVDEPAVPPVIIAPARAVMVRTMLRREFLKATRSIKTGQTIHLEETIRYWVSIGYDPVNTVINPGQFARRGGILDLWPPVYSLPIRIELFGDEIESIRFFEPSTQRTIKSNDNPPQEKYLISPAREFLRDTSLPQTAQQEAEEYSEFHIPLLHPSPAGVLDYLPSKTLILIDDFQAVQETIEDIEEQSVKRRQDYLQDGTLDNNFPIPYLTRAEITDFLHSKQHLDLGYTTDFQYEELVESPLAGQFSVCPRFAGMLKPFMDHVVESASNGEQLVIVSRQKSRLDELWQERAIQPDPQNHDHPAVNQQEPSTDLNVQFIQGSLTEGWKFSPTWGNPIQLLTDGEIFGWKRPEPRQRPRKAAKAPEAIYADLQAGDYVVHVDHGIGVFVGLVNRSIDGSEREYLCIEYADEAQLFVPVHQADRLSVYVGADTRQPALSRLGSAEWRTVKNHVKEAVVEVAEDLLELYAKRNIIQGYEFSPDNNWQEELEASFPYIETEDQLRVLEEVKADMQSTRPMDRLICGDVGYGKTEVALRAAFKAVMDGKQVAMLVPTTVLAQQHYDTFCQRLTAFPVNVEMLSRFRTPAEQRVIIEKLEQGKIDIIIGTHRLLSSDVKLKDLGLLIIDEEQRFGVTHKETLKQMRTEVDVLTLTATPIPRTLYLALTGVRDISTINTPPEERLPISTYVGPYHPSLARRAVMRELERGGQVFFVHNRVQTIQSMRCHLEQLIPEARITVAHGQMPEHELSERMKQFTRGEVDILLSTSIIESGLDIPNANTLIVDRADTFGLAQLYQLRGRVGRGAQRAYAYFFRHTRKLPTLEGQQRLDTIAENADLGAGFSVAMRDLEIRGTGDILGTRQHGHITAIGFHLYTRLLASAVKRLRKDSPIPLPDTRLISEIENGIPVNVDLPLQVSIPSDYVPEKTMRLRLYRRLAGAQSVSELKDLEDEFSDRFGSLPKLVQNLFFQLKVKIMGERAGLSSVTSENGQLVLRYPESKLPDQFPELNAGIRVGKTALWLSQKNNPDWADILYETLQSLSKERHA
ncbi:MAG: transcription-repair coupling factor [Anaerolineales bacterium]|nr:transcription-repair coupling factor [Anaerolineales bacterium]